MDTDGFFLCGHCHRVVSLSPCQIEAAESAPDGKLTNLKCPLCRHYDVSWRTISEPKPKPAPKPISAERVRELCAQLRETIKLL